MIRRRSWRTEVFAGDADQHKIDSNRKCIVNLSYMMYMYFTVDCLLGNLFSGSERNNKLMFPEVASILAAYLRNTH